MKKLAINLRKVDLFGKSLIFEEKESQKHHTLIGNIMTFSVIITCCIIGFMFGNEIYERKTPTVIVSEDIIDTSRFTFKEYPLIFSFAYFDGTPIRDSHLAFNLNVGNMTVSPTFDSVFSEKKGGLRNCTVDMFIEKYQPIVSKILTDNANAGRSSLDMICPDPDAFVQNPYISANSTFLNFRFSLCNSTERTCHPNQSRISQDFYIIVRTVEAFIDPKNYTHPIVYYANTQPQQVSNFLMKRNFYSIEKRKLITYQGWLLDSTVEEEFFTVKEVLKDVNPTFRNDLFQATFTSATRRMVTTRRYMKIQDLFASIGGFFNFLYIICTILLKDYVDFNYYYSYLKSLKEDNSTKSNSINRSKSIQMLIKNESMKVNKKPWQINSINIDKINDSSALVNDHSNNKIMHNNEKILNNNFINNKLDAPITPIKPVTPITQVEKFSVSQIRQGNVNYENTKNQVENLHNVSIQQVNLDKSLNPYIDNFRTNKLNSFDPHLFADGNYFSYLWNDTICCKSKLVYHIKAIRTILSFKNILELSMDSTYKKLSVEEGEIKF